MTGGSTERARKALPGAAAKLSPWWIVLAMSLSGAALLAWSLVREHTFGPG